MSTILIVVILIVLIISSSSAAGVAYWYGLFETDAGEDFLTPPTGATNPGEDTEENTYYITELGGTCSSSDELITDTTECKQAIDKLIPNNMTFMRTRDNQDGWEGVKATHPNGCSYMNKYDTSQHVLTTGSNSVGTGASHLHAVCKKPTT